MPVAGIVVGRIAPYTGNIAPYKAKIVAVDTPAAPDTVGIAAGIAVVAGTVAGQNRQTYRWRAGHRQRWFRH